MVFGANEDGAVHVYSKSLGNNLALSFSLASLFRTVHEVDSQRDGERERAPIAAVDALRTQAGDVYELTALRLELIRLIGHRNMPLRAPQASGKPIMEFL